MPSLRFICRRSEANSLRNSVAGITRKYLYKQIDKTIKNEYIDKVLDNSPKVIRLQDVIRSECLGDVLVHIGGKR